MSRLDPTILSSARAARERLLDREHELERARADLNHEIRRLHAAGGSMRQISEKLGLSHQRVHQIVSDADAPAESVLRRLTDRLQRGVSDPAIHLTEQARTAVARSRQEAINSGARGIRPEHLLLALALPEAGSSASALASAGVGSDALLRAFQDTTGALTPGDRRVAPGRLAPATKKALELSLRQAARRGDDHIGTEHLLLGILRGADARTMMILESSGATPTAIQDAVDALPRET
jgi:transcriptional regulator with XRE-family HTH domain